MTSQFVAFFEYRWAIPLGRDPVFTIEGHVPRLHVGWRAVPNGEHLTNFGGLTWPG